MCLEGPATAAESRVLGNHAAYGVSDRHGHPGGKNSAQFGAVFGKVIARETDPVCGHLVGNRDRPCLTVYDQPAVLQQIRDAAEVEYAEQIYPEASLSFAQRAEDADEPCHTGMIGAFKSRQVSPERAVHRLFAGVIE